MKTWMIIALLLLCGCQSAMRVDGATTSIHRATKSAEPVVTRETTTTRFPDGTTQDSVRSTTQGPSVETTSTASATGASSRASGEKVEGVVRGEAPTLDLDGWTASGGGFLSKASLSGKGAGSIAAFIFGALAIGAGIYVVSALRAWTAGLALAAVGAIVVIGAIWPQFLAWAFLAGLVLAGLALWWNSRRFSNTQDALGVVTAAVQESDSAQDIKRSVGLIASDAHRFEIGQAKKRWSST